VVQSVSILERLARREREALRRGEELVRKVDANVLKVDVSEKPAPPPVPAGVDAREWASWGEEARYVYEERMGVGTELGMTEAAASVQALTEARLAHAGVPSSAWSLVGKALATFEGCRIVSVKPRSKP
jgi:hypothetical protein